jgi:DNA-binding response OmpR family regulator
MTRVLIIEDEEKMARALARVLGEEGHITETAHDGRTGLSRALEDSFDLLIVDWMLPERQGENRSDLRAICCAARKRRLYTLTSGY